MVGRTVLGIAARVAVCREGHTEAIGEPELAVLSRCGHCGQWTWEDGRFCVRCGVRRREVRSDGG